MRILTQREAILTACERWLNQHKRQLDDSVPWWPRTGAKTFGSIRAKLAALDLNSCTAAEFHSAIGTTGWATNECDECGLEAETLVRFGDEPDYEARWQDLCHDCLSSAVTKLLAKPDSQQ